MTFPSGRRCARMCGRHFPEGRLGSIENCWWKGCWRKVLGTCLSPCSSRGASAGPSRLRFVVRTATRRPALRKAAVCARQPTTPRRNVANSTKLFLMQTTASEYYRGLVDDYNDREGYGYISPDPDQNISGVLQFHRASLRSRTMRLRSGDRVLFSIKELQQGGSAADVHPELVEEGELEPRVWGSVDWYVPERGLALLRNRRADEPSFVID